MGSLVSRPSALLLRSQSDERLLELAREGHERAFEAIVERYRRPLLRACRRVLPEGRAEDAVQQALVAAWTAIERGYEVRELRPWLFRIAHNTALNQLRVSGYDHVELLDGLRGGPAPEEELERRIVVRATLAGIAALPERQRQALLRIAVEGRPQEDVAAELGVSEGAVRQLVHRARVQLRAAATAVTPLPIAIWMADLAGGAATAGGAAATALKAGAAVVLVTGAAAGPALVHHGAPHAGRRDTAAAAPPAHPHRATAAAVADVVRVAEPAPAAATPAATAEPRGDRGERSGSTTHSGARRVSGSGSGPGSGSGSGEAPTRSGGAPGPSSSSRDDSGDDHPESGDRAPAPSSGSSGSGSRESGDGHGGSSGRGDDSTAPATGVPVSTPSGGDGGEDETVEATDDSGSPDGSGSGSGDGDRTVLAQPVDSSPSGGGDDGASSGHD
jgi:RNA polymerase sigma factor (sigma-70 family)